MSIREFLPTIRTVRDFPAFALELGFEPTWHELSLAPLGITDGPSAAVLVGRRSGLMAFGVTSVDPERTATRIAGALSRRATLGIVFAVDPGGRTLSVAAGTRDAPTATIALGNVRTLDQRILERATALTDSSPIGLCLGWAEALSGRSLDQRFFQQFRATLASAVDALPRRIPRQDRHALALLDLTRVLFLYFVQERGWLDGRPRFLREELDRSLQVGEVDRRFLEPLFFETLNRPAAKRTANARRFGAIPFLNGGLFEPHPLEERWPVTLPDEVWRAAFEELFERYHFTIAAERGPAATISPDMLGRVFERVMDPETRRETGAFYTPSALVDRLVHAGLTGWLAGALACDMHDAAQRCASPDPEAIEKIRAITVLDPAVGSGAFLLGVLRRLVGARVAAGESAGAATRAVIATNLFGVDINPNAVHLAELRLWLEVIQADPDGDPAHVEPLPNLDALIRQGDSIFERVGLPFTLPATDAAELGRLRAAVVAATGPAKRVGLGALRKAEISAAGAGLAGAVARVEARIRELTTAGRSRSLFGERGSLDGRGRAALGALRRERTELRRLGRRLAATGQLPWFHFGSQFADVMGQGGFDLTVGNPPWVRAEALTPRQRESLKIRYRWFRGSGAKRGFAPLPDLAIVFLERSLELVRDRGVVAFLVPAKLRTAQYASAAREGLASRTTLRLAVEVTEGHGFDALVYPMALVAERMPPAADHVVATSWDLTATIPQLALGAAPWIRAGMVDADRFDRFPTIGDRFVVRLGVKTGADTIFLDPPTNVERELIRTAIRGRDIAPFRVAAGRRILWTHDERGAPLAELPPQAAKMLGPNLRRLRNRADFRGGAAWTVFRIEGARAAHRVVWPDLARELTAATLGAGRGAPMPLNTCYWIKTPDETTAAALAAWFNSTPIRASAKARATMAASGFSRFNADTVESLPLPTAAVADAELASIAREAARGSFDQARLDDRVRLLLAGEPLGDHDPRA